MSCLRPLVLLVLLVTPVLAGPPEWMAVARAGMVASDSPEASRIGAEVLKAGGNAFDAAIATSFALTVARPQSTGIGGGGFMLAYVAETGEFVALDFREMAPAAYDPVNYRAKHQDHQRRKLPSASIYGGHAVGVPGLVAGLTEIHARYATRGWSELVAPAITLADQGFAVDEHLLSARRSALEEMEEHAHIAKIGQQLARLLRDEGPADWQAGSLFRRPQMARTLRLIAREGKDAIYGGPIGQDIVMTVEGAQGRMTTDDLRAYPVLARTPIRFTYGDYEVISMPPPSSGGIALAETLQILAERNYGQLRGDAPGDARHVLVEAMKHAFADRARWLGDADHAWVPVRTLTSPQYAGRLAAGIELDRTHELQAYGSLEPPPDDAGTSHFSIADRHGNIVALTETINGVWGSYLVTPKFGVILNNEIDDFLTHPGRENLFNLEQADANLIGPHKRPLSSMTPTIILKDGKPFLTLGASGGPRIISSVMQVALAVMHGADPAEVLSAPRLHHQWKPDEIYFDREAPADVVADLERRGHTVAERRRGANVQAICFTPEGEMIGLSDPKKGGRPAGVD